MPAQQMFTAEEFQKFLDFMQLRGLTVEYPRDFHTNKTRLGLVSHRKKSGSQVKLRYHNHGLTLKVCTTADSQLNEPLPKRYGWVLIDDHDEAKYFSHPFLRTEGFLRRVYYHTIINKYRIDHRPICPCCKKYMDIVRGRGVKSRYWKCPNHDHEPETMGWDENLPQWMQNYLKPIRKARAKQKKKYEIAQAEKGKVVIPAVYRRIPWEMQNPQNKI